MKFQKRYYIVQATCGALGAIGSTVRMPDDMTGKTTNKRHMEKVLDHYREENDNPRIVYWLDFEWMPR